MTQITSTKSAVRVDGIQLTYLTYGKPDAPPMLLLHALFMDAKDWSKVAEAFSERFRIYALNLRGHGSSDWPGEYSFELMARDVTGFLDVLGIERIVLMGHSLGGIVSCFVAAMQPERIEALVLEESPPPKPGGSSFDFGPCPKGKLPYDWLAVSAVMSQLNNPDPAWWSMLGRISAPTLVIGGGATSHVPQSWNADLAAAIPDARLVTLGGGHFVHQKDLKRFIYEIASFLPGSQVSNTR